MTWSKNHQLIKEGFIAREVESSVLTNILSLDVRRFTVKKQQFAECLLFPSYLTLLLKLISKTVLWEEGYYPMCQISQQGDWTQDCLTLELNGTLGTVCSFPLHCAVLLWLTWWRAQAVSQHRHFWGSVEICWHLVTSIHHAHKTSPWVQCQRVLRPPWKPSCISLPPHSQFKKHLVCSL